MLLLASLLLNIYSAAVWGFACYAHSGVAERSTYYRQFTAGSDPRTFSVGAFTVTLLSLIVFIAAVRKLRGWYIAVAIVQALFALLYVWQLS